MRVWFKAWAERRRGDAQNPGAVLLRKFSSTLGFSIIFRWDSADKVSIGEAMNGTVHFDGLLVNFASYPKATVEQWVL